MKHFHRCHAHPDAVMQAADSFFPTVQLQRTATGPRTRTFSGPLGTATITVRMEGGHHTFVEAHTDQTGESRLDRTVKKFFVALHAAEHPEHALGASY